MKNVIVSMLIVAVLATGVCIFSVQSVTRVCTEMEEMRLKALQLGEKRDMQQALGQIERMQQYWKDSAQVLTIVLPHSCVGEVSAALIEAGADLLADEADEFVGDMLLLGEILERIRAEEQLYLCNILSIC